MMYQLQDGDWVNTKNISYMRKRSGTTDLATGKIDYTWALKMSDGEEFILGLRQSEPPKDYIYIENIIMQGAK